MNLQVAQQWHFSILGLVQQVHFVFCCLLISILATLVPRTSNHYSSVLINLPLGSSSNKKSLRFFLGSLRGVEERRPGLTSHQVWIVGRCTASLWIQAYKWP